jgi:hypothetical protein
LNSIFNLISGAILDGNGIPINTTHLARSSEKLIPSLILPLHIAKRIDPPLLLPLPNKGIISPNYPLY